MIWSSTWRLRKSPRETLPDVVIYVATTATLYLLIDGETSISNERDEEFEVPYEQEICICPKCIAKDITHEQVIEIIHLFLQALEEE